MRVLMLVIMLAFAAPALASPPQDLEEMCSELEALEHTLQTKFAERLEIVGTKRGKGQYHIYYSDSRGTYTIVWVYNDGRACVRGFGSGKPGMAGENT